MFLHGFPSGIVLGDVFPLCYTGDLLVSCRFLLPFGVLRGGLFWCHLELLPLLKVTSSLLVRSVAIRSWGSIISVKIWLERVSNLYIGSSVFGGVLLVLVDLIFFLIFFIWPFAVGM